MHYCTCSCTIIQCTVFVSLIETTHTKIVLKLVPVASSADKHGLLQTSRPVSATQEVLSCADRWHEFTQGLRRKTVVYRMVASMLEKLPMQQLAYSASTLRSGIRHRTPHIQIQCDFLYDASWNICGWTF